MGGSDPPEMWDDGEGVAGKGGINGVCHEIPIFGGFPGWIWPRRCQEPFCALCRHFAGLRILNTNLRL